MWLWSLRSGMYVCMNVDTFEVHHLDLDPVRAWLHPISLYTHTLQQLIFSPKYCPCLLWWVLGRSIWCQSNHPLFPLLHRGGPGAICHRCRYGSMCMCMYHLCLCLCKYCTSNVIHGFTCVLRFALTESEERIRTPTHTHTHILSFAMYCTYILHTCAHGTCVHTDAKSYSLAIFARVVFGIGGECLTVAQSTILCQWFKVYMHHRMRRVCMYICIPACNHTRIHA